MMTVHPDGTRTVLQDGPAIYLRGDGASPAGDRPFLDRLDLTDLGTQPAVPVSPRTPTSTCWASGRSTATTC